MTNVKEVYKNIFDDAVVVDSKRYVSEEKLIPVLTFLLRESRMLTKLDEHGVDNWPGYEDAMMDYYKEYHPKELD